MIQAMIQACRRYKHSAARTYAGWNDFHFSRLHCLFGVVKNKKEKKEMQMTLGAHPYSSFHSFIQSSIHSFSEIYLFRRLVCIRALAARKEFLHCCNTIIILKMCSVHFRPRPWFSSISLAAKWDGHPAYLQVPYSKVGLQRSICIFICCAANR